MTTYLKMWARIHTLDVHEVNDLLSRLDEPNGRIVSFQGIPVVDIDLIEALRDWKQHAPSKMM